MKSRVLWRSWGYMIGYKVIDHRIELDWSILEEYIQTKKEICTSVDVLGRVELR